MDFFCNVGPKSWLNKRIENLWTGFNLARVEFCYETDWFYSCAQRLKRCNRQDNFRSEPLSVKLWAFTAINPIEIFQEVGRNGNWFSI